MAQEMLELGILIWVVAVVSVVAYFDFESYVNKDKSVSKLTRLDWFITALLAFAVIFESIVNNHKYPYIQIANTILFVSYIFQHYLYRLDN